MLAHRIPPGWEFRDGPAPRCREAETPENIANPRLRSAKKPGEFCPHALAYPGLYSRLTPWVRTSPHPRHPHRGALSFLPDRGPTRGGGRVEEGWHFLAAASLAQGRSAKALTDRHQMLFRAAPGLAHSFRFSTVGNKERRACTRHEPPASGGGPRPRRSKAAELHERGPCIGSGKWAAAAPAPSIQPYSLAHLGNIGEDYFTPWKRIQRSWSSRQNT